MNASMTVNIVPSTPNVPSPWLESVNQPPFGARRRRSSLMAIAAVTTTTRTSAEIHVRTDEHSSRALGLVVPSVSKNPGEDIGASLRSCGQRITTNPPRRVRKTH